MEIALELDPLDNPYTIAPLLLLPLLENSFKHVGRNRSGRYAVQGKIKLQEGKLMVSLQNTIAAVHQTTELPITGGIGLVNLQKRLDLLYPERYYFNTISTGDEFVAVLELQLKS
jgi:LytS/YehU family sensor histidine kinase